VNCFRPDTTACELMLHAVAEPSSMPQVPRVSLTTANAAQHLQHPCGWAQLSLVEVRHRDGWMEVAEKLSESTTPREYVLCNKG
jgi:hypothetical protein